MEPRYIVVEHYPDGGIQTHHFYSLDDAEYARYTMRKVNPGRQYELRDAEGN